MGITSRENEKYIEEWERKYGLPYHMRDSISNAESEYIFFYHFNSDQKEEDRNKIADRVVEDLYGHEIARHIFERKKKKEK